MSEAILTGSSVDVDGNSAFNLEVQKRFSLLHAG
jgi:hypothetical protein